MRFKIQDSRRLLVVLVATLAFFIFAGTSQAVYIPPVYLPLNLTPQAPDIMSPSGVSVTYDKQSLAGGIATGQLVVTGKCTGLDIDNAAPPNDFWMYPTFAYSTPSSDFTIDIMLEADMSDANPDNWSITATSGTIEILGYLADARGGVPPAPPLVSGSGTLLTGDVTDFGFSNGGIFEFLFTSTGGDLTSASYVPDLAPIFGPVDTAVGVVTNPNQDAGGNPFSTFFQPLGLDAFTADFANNCTGTSDAYAVPEPSTLMGLVSLLLASMYTVWRRK